jgi:hypothetical protein
VLPLSALVQTCLSHYCSCHPITRQGASLMEAVPEPARGSADAVPSPTSTLEQCAVHIVQHMHLYILPL